MCAGYSSANEREWQTEIVPYEAYRYKTYRINVKIFIFSDRDSVFFCFCNYAVIGNFSRKIK